MGTLRAVILRAHFSYSLQLLFLIAANGATNKNYIPYLSEEHDFSQQVSINLLSLL